MTSCNAAKQRPASGGREVAKPAEETARDASGRSRDVISGRSALDVGFGMSRAAVLPDSTDGAAVSTIQRSCAGVAKAGVSWRIVSARLCPAHAHRASRAADSILMVL
jgi:hypothetical protein